MKWILCERQLIRAITAINRRKLRCLLVRTGLGVTSLVLVLQVANLNQRGTLLRNDFVAYWAAGRLNLAGGNPYAPDQLLRLEQQAGWTRDEPLHLWNPPWLLAVIMPFSLPSYPVGGLLWLALNLGVTAIAIDWCWRLYGGSHRSRMLALIISFSFGPTLINFEFGQLAPLMLLGMGGFLHFEGQRRWFLAGVLPALALFKPQLVYLFWLALLLWAVKERRGMTLLGVVAACAVATAIAWLPNRAVIGQYLASLVNSPVWAFLPHTAGGLLRFLLGTERLWVQFVLLPFGIAWLAAYWHRHHSHWDWAEQTPLLLLVSLVTTPYGWTSDEMVLLVPVLQMLALLQRVGRRSLTIGGILFYATFNVLMLLPWLSGVYGWHLGWPLVYLGLYGSAAILLAVYIPLRMSMGAGRRMVPHLVEG